MERNIRTLIDERGYKSMSSFSRATGLSHMTVVSAIDSPKGLSNTSHTNFRAIANALGMTCDELYDWLNES